MLTVTDEAVEAVKKMVERSDFPETGGLRIYSTPVRDPKPPSSSPSSPNLGQPATS